MKLVRDGELVRLSKRTGNIITLADILDEVDPDVARLTFLLQGIDTTQTFDLDVVTRAVDGEPRLLRAVRARPHRVDRPARPPSAGVDAAARSPTSTSRRSCTSASSTCCARSRSTPTCVAEAAALRAPAPRHHLGARLRQRVPRLLPRLPCDHRRRRAHAGPAVAGRGVPDRSRRRARRSSACTRPTRWSASTTSDGAIDAATPMSARPAASARRSTATLRARRGCGGVRPRRARRPSSARRCSSTTRTSCAARCRDVRRRVRRRGGRVRGQGVPLHGDGAARRRGGPPPRRRHRRRAARRAARRVPARAASCSTATTSPTPSCAPRSNVGVGRVVADSFDELDRLEALVADGCRRARRARPRHAGCRGAHPRVHRDRHRRLEVRLHGRERRRARRRRCASPSRDALRLRRAPLPHRLADLPRSTRTRRRRRSSASFAAEVRARRPARTVDELNLGGGLGVRVPRRRPDAPSIATFAAVLRDASPTACATPGSTRARLTVEPGRSIAGAGGRSRSTASARSRRSPACAPTSRSTAA